MSKNDLLEGYMYDTWNYGQELQEWEIKKIPKDLIEKTRKKWEKQNG